MGEKLVLRKEMTLKDLKTGMVVEMRNGNKYLIYPSVETEGLVLIRESGYVEMNSLDADMKNNWGTSPFDVMKVFDARCDSDLALRNWKNMILLWERKEELIEITLKPVEITMEEIAKLKGCKVENLKIIK